MTHICVCVDIRHWNQTRSHCERWFLFNIHVRFCHTNVIAYYFTEYTIRRDVWWRMERRLASTTCVIHNTMNDPVDFLHWVGDTKLRSYPPVAVELVGDLNNHGTCLNLYAGHTVRVACVGLKKFIDEQAPHYNRCGLWMCHLSFQGIEANFENGLRVICHIRRKGCHWWHWCHRQ